MTIYKIILLAIFFLKIGIDFGINAKKWQDKRVSGERFVSVMIASLLIYGTLLFLIYKA